MGVDNHLDIFQALFQAVLRLFLQSAIQIGEFATLDRRLELFPLFFTSLVKFNQLGNLKLFENIVTLGADILSDDREPGVPFPAAVARQQLQDDLCEELVQDALQDVANGRGEDQGELELLV